MPLQQHSPPPRTTAMVETSCFPESFDEVVRLVVQGQMEAAGIVWDGTMERMAEYVQENQTNDRGQ
jgi:hypothetical protein